MNLTTKAALIIVGNVVVSFAVGLLSREYLLNPALLEIEYQTDQRDVARFDRALERYQSQLQARIEGLSALVRLVPSEFSGSHWPELLNATGTERIDYLLISNPTSNYVQRVPMDNGLHRNELPQAIHMGLAHAAQRFNRSGPVSFNGRITTGPDEAFIYAATALEFPAASVAGMLFAARSVDAALVAQLNESLELNAELISLELFSKLAEAQRHGARNDSNQYYALLRAAGGQPLLALRFNAAPRAFDDQFVTPTIVVALLFALLSWVLVIVLMHRTVIAPIVQVSKTMRQIRQSSDYTKTLTYPQGDELGRLVDECNELLRHVSQQTSELRFFSYKDPLTQLGNRRLMQDRIGQIWSLCQRQKIPVSIIVFDLDYFKQYNDVYGHPAGDKALQAFSALLHQYFKRESDLVIRSGGEEFIAILPGLDQELASGQANLVSKALWDREIAHRGNHESGRLTVSAGLASAIPSAKISIEQLMEEADHALYRAKQQGRNRLLSYQWPA